MKHKRYSLVILSFLLLLTAVCIGCAGCTGNNSSDKTGDDKNMSMIESEITAVPLPEGTQLKHFYMTRQGMAMEPYYILKTTDDGIFMKITNIRPYDERMLGDDAYTVQGSEKYLAFADTVKECENAELIQLKDDAFVRLLENAIEETGALQWDGYCKNVSKPGVSDSGDRYEMYFELSDGTTVTMDSYNICPAGFTKLLAMVSEVFNKAL